MWFSLFMFQNTSVVRKCRVRWRCPCLQKKGFSVVSSERLHKLNNGRESTYPLIHSSLPVWKLIKVGCQGHRITRWHDGSSCWLHIDTKVERNNTASSMLTWLECMYFEWETTQTRIHGLFQCKIESPRHTMFYQNFHNSWVVNKDVRTKSGRRKVHIDTRRNALSSDPIWFYEIATVHCTTFTQIFPPAKNEYFVRMCRKIPAYTSHWKACLVKRQNRQVTGC